jgi:uncharacterized protein (DUF2126 family)
VDGVTLPLRPERDSRGDLKVFGVRYASFAPRSGLHPVLGSQAPLTLTLGHADHDVQYDITLHEWRPDGEAYPGLPADLLEAGERRAARMTVVARDRPVQAPLTNQHRGKPCKPGADGLQPGSAVPVNGLRAHGGVGCGVFELCSAHIHQFQFDSG